MTVSPTARLGHRTEQHAVTELHCSASQSCLIALLQDKVVRVYKQLQRHSGSGLRPVLQVPPWRNSCHPYGDSLLQL